MCECGRPKFECRHPDNAGAYEAADVTCHAQAAVEERTGGKDFKPEPGQRFYAVEIDESVITRRTFAPPHGDEVNNAYGGEPQNEYGDTDAQTETPNKSGQR